MKTIVSVLGIRPDIIRMCFVLKELDKHFNHIIIHSGQHFNKSLSGDFFKELGLRDPDYNLGVGGKGREHFHQSADLSVKIIELFREKNINPDIVLFLGDSNSVLAAVPLKKEGYKIGHIEAGMRSGDKSMMEEINRIVCDHCSDCHFVYHENYKKKLEKEGVNSRNIYVVGNTIVEPIKQFSKDIIKFPKKLNQILLDVHRPENFKNEGRLKWIINTANRYSNIYNLPVKMLDFPRTTEYIKDWNVDIGSIEMVDLMPFGKYLNEVYNSKFVISDSGSEQENILGTKVIVPRDFTERPESMTNNCSFMLNEDNFNESVDWLNSNFEIKTDWLGDGQTSKRIVKILKEYL